MGQSFIGLVWTKGLYLFVFISVLLFSACSKKPPTHEDHAHSKPLASDLLAAPNRPENSVQAPAYFKVEFICSNGRFVVEARREWAPKGVDRFYNLVKNGYYEGSAFFRVVPNFIVQFGIHPEPIIHKAWDTMMIPDDVTRESNYRGTLSYGTRGPNSRTTHLVINFQDNSRHLDPTNPVIAKVIEGMDIVDSIYSAYGDLPQFGGKSPDPSRMSNEGYAFLENEFPNLDYIEFVNFIP